MGGEVYDVRLLRAMVDLGVSFEVIAPIVDALAVEPSPGIRVHPASFRRARYSNAAFLGEALRLHRRGHFDVFRVHTPVFVGAAGALFRFLRPQVPVIYHHHHLEDSILERTLTALVARCATASVAASAFSKSQLVEQTGADSNSVHIVHPGVDRPPQPAPRAGAVSDEHGLVGKQVIVTVGTLTDRKNVVELVRLMPEVLSRVPEAHLVVIGDGPERSFLHEEVSRLGLFRSVLLTGHVSEERKAEWLYASAVYASLSKMEGFGLAVAEAQSVGLPAVVSSSGSLPEVVVDGETGLVAGTGDARAAVGALCTLLQDSTLRERMGRKAQDRVARSFTWYAAATAVHALYTHAVDDCRGRRSRPHPGGRR